MSFNSKLNVTELKNGFGYGSLKIDIGGIALIRAAAKNYNDVTVITKAEQYNKLINELKKIVVLPL